jgi:O-antigen/teichoic acid export membrane protein
MNTYIILLVEQTRWLPLMIGIAAATNAVINIALIPRIGIMGAAVSTIVAYSVLATIVMVWARRAISYKMDFRFLGKVIGATVVMALCLRFMPIGSGWRLVLAIIAGTAIFALGLWLLRAVSVQDKRIVKEIVLGLNPKLSRGGK